MAKTIFHPEASRGKADLGWLKSHHTFSFGNYYDPERMGFGALRVLNDDTVTGGEGFGEHPHDNMEIISISLNGGLKHQDSMENVAVIVDGDIQVMSAGTGIFHEEHNDDDERDVQFLQIWVYPNVLNVEPRYDQLTLNKADRQNKLQQILSPNKDDDGVWIYQDAWFNLGNFDKGRNTEYNLHTKNSGVYVFVISGSVEINGQVLNTRDGFGIWETDKISIDILDNAEVLLMEVPIKTTKILSVGKHPDIMATIQRLINNKAGWHGTVAFTVAEALAQNTTFDIVLLGAGLSEQETKELQSHFTVPVVQHYGGGSGLLYAEIYETLAKN